MSDSPKHTVAKSDIIGITDRAQEVGPRNKREARRWVREHWAYLIEFADMGAVGDLENQHIDAIWDDECRKIARRIIRKESNHDQ